MRARGKESVNVASFALVRDGIFVRVCVHGSPRARRPLVVWLRFAASRLGRGGGGGLLTLICPLRPRRRSDPHGHATGDQTGPCTGRDGEPVQSGASSDFGFPVRIIPYHIPTLLIENLDIVHRRPWSGHIYD